MEHRDTFWGADSHTEQFEGNSFRQMHLIRLASRKSAQSLRTDFGHTYIILFNSEKTQHRTKTVVNTNEPIWNQTFVYSPISRSEMRQKALEINVCDYDRYCSNELLGQVVIELYSAPLDDEFEWYLLASREEIIAQLVSIRKVSYSQLSQFLTAT